MSARGRAEHLALNTTFGTSQAGDVPDWLAARHGSARAWKSLKRQQAQAVRKAVRDLYTGCAFFPGDGTALAQRLKDATAEIVHALSIKGWGR